MSVRNRAFLTVSGLRRVPITTSYFMSRHTRAQPRRTSALSGAGPLHSLTAPPKRKDFRPVRALAHSLLGGSWASSEAVQRIPAARPATTQPRLELRRLPDGSRFPARLDSPTGIRLSSRTVTRLLAGGLGEAAPPRVVRAKPDTSFRFLPNGVRARLCRRASVQSIVLCRGGCLPALTLQLHNRLIPGVTCLGVELLRWIT